MQQWLLASLLSLLVIYANCSEGPTTSSPQLAEIIDAETPSKVLAGAAWEEHGLALIGQWQLQSHALEQALSLAEMDADWAYPASGVLLLGEDGALQQAIHFAAGAFLPSDLQVGPDGVWIAGYIGQGFSQWLDTQQTPGLRQHYEDFPQRQLQVHTPGEHHDEPRRDPTIDQRGAPAVLHFSSDGRELLAAATLEGWQSTWFVPAQVQETWWQPVLLERLADGDLVVVHDGGYNRFPPAGEDAGFVEFCLAEDYISRLSPDLQERRWRSNMRGPPIDAEKISAQIRSGRHFTETTVDTWEHDVLGNPRAWSIARADDDAVWVAGWSASRTDIEPWWCPFIRHVDGHGVVQDGPWSPSPTDGDGRLGGQVSDTAVRAIAPTSDGGLAVILLSDGGNNVSRRDPWNPLASPDGPWFGQPDPFRGRTLFWSGVTRLIHDPDAPMNLGFAWGRHLGGQGRDRRNRHTTRPAWAEHLLVLEDDALVVAGRVASETRILDRQNTEDGAWIGRIDADGAHGEPHLLPRVRINALFRTNSSVHIAGQRDGHFFFQSFPLDTFTDTP